MPSNGTSYAISWPASGGCPTLGMADPCTIDQANYLLWVAHNLERTADRVTNICERVVFTVTGEMMEMDAEEGLIGIA